MVLPSNRPSPIRINFLPLLLPGVLPQPTERLATQERLRPTRHRAVVRKTQLQAKRRETAATECLVDGPVPRKRNSPNSEAWLSEASQPRYPSRDSADTSRCTPLPPPHMSSLSPPALSWWTGGQHPGHSSLSGLRALPPSRFISPYFWALPQTPLCSPFHSI